jgi:hypothetical protein
MDPTDPDGRQRQGRLRSLEDSIGDHLRSSADEMRRSPAWGKPLPDDGYMQAPPELRMAFKLLKDAGHVPAEVALMQELQAWRDELAALPPGVAAEALKRRIAERELLIAMRVERLGKTLSL